MEVKLKIWDQGRYIKMLNDSIKKEFLKYEKILSKCVQCHGQGWVVIDHNHPKSEYATQCPLCNGSGKIDWIKKMMGPRPISNNTIQWKLRCPSNKYRTTERSITE